MCKHLMKRIGLAMLAATFLLVSNSSQANDISGYDGLIALYGKGLSASGRAALKDAITKAEDQALDQILKNELTSMAGERRFILQQSKEGIPTKFIDINNNYTAVGFEKTFFYKGTWEKAAYILLFEKKGSQSLRYTGDYLFWRGNNSVDDYKKIKKKNLCKEFSTLKKLVNCGDDAPATVAEVEKPPTSKPTPTSQVTPRQVQINSDMEEKVDALQDKVRRLNIAIDGKADEKHTHSGGDITSGIISEKYIDRTITRDRELKNLRGDAPVVQSENGAVADSTYVKSLENRIIAMEETIKELTGRLRGISRVRDTIIFNGVNVQITNGTGSTDGAVNGLGNLIIGYNEPRTGANPTERTGSHNLIVGIEHNYTSYGGFTAGSSNTISGAYSSVTGGLWNVASGDYSTVNGGHFRNAEGMYEEAGTIIKDTSQNEEPKGGCGGCGCN